MKYCFGFALLLAVLQFGHDKLDWWVAVPIGFGFALFILVVCQKADLYDRERKEKK
jgi:hypothetical protein